MQAQRTLWRWRRIGGVMLAALAATGGSSCRQSPPPPPPTGLTSPMEFSLRVMEMLLGEQRAASPGAAATSPTTSPVGPPTTKNAAPAPLAPVVHVVLVWLKQPGDPSARAALLRSADVLRTIPDVIEVRAGVPLASTRPSVDATWDVGFTITFANEAALRSYESDPIHQRLVQEVLQPVAERRLIYDFGPAKTLKTERPDGE